AGLLATIIGMFAFACGLVTSQQPAAATVSGTVGPLHITVDPTTELTNLQPVHVDVVADSGSSLFSNEARLCRGGVTIVGQSGFNYSTGNCAPLPISPGADYKVLAFPEAPFSFGTLDWKVGIGTETWDTPSGPATLTCDFEHPCQLVLKL